MYNVRIERKAQKKLAQIPKHYYSKIKEAILSLSENPRPIGCKKLTDVEAYRIRVGNYRIIYEIFDKELIVNIVALGVSGNIYD